MMSESPGSVMLRVQTLKYFPGGSQLNIVACVVMDSSLSKHSVVFDFTFPERRDVVGNNDKLSFALTEGLQGLLVSQDIFTTFHNQSKASVDRFNRLFGF